ncbi:MAG: glycosyltransferase family 4 protein [Methylovulum sp.]|nr:glycosyltransferase family 4 protein [Methylovulum sp.]
MKILIDGFLIFKPRGLGRYVREVLNALALNLPSDIEVIALIPKGVDTNTFVGRGRIEYQEYPNVPYPIWEQFIIPFAVARLKPDVCHCPYNTIPMLRFGTRYVITIHDLIFEQSLGKGWYQNVGNIYRRLMLSSIKQHPPIVITVSKESARLILQSVGVVASVMYTPTETVGLDVIEDGKAVSPCTTKTILHIGGTAAHKNTKRVIEAFLVLNRDDYRLVILGMGSDSSLAKIFSTNQIVFPGWVDDVTIVRLFGESSLLVFPSLMEGYGLPIVEGFTAGVPVLTSAKPPMSEIAGDAALLVNPESVEAIAAGMRRILDDSTFAANLIEKGKDRLRVINSLELCNALIKVYREAVSNTIKGEDNS